MGDGRYKGMPFQPKAKVSKARLWLIKNGHKQLFQKESKMLNIVSADEPIEDKCKAADAFRQMAMELAVATIKDHTGQPTKCCEDEAAKSPEMVRFLDEIESVCIKHGMSISHQDSHGRFIIEGYKQENIDWLKDASEER
jgi:hypothetical protein